MPKGVKGFQKGHKTTKQTRQKIGNALRKSITFKCDYCSKQSITPPSHYKKKKKHFCSTECYAKFRKEKLSYWEQNAYKGIRQKDESKQVYHRNYCNNHPTNISHLKARGYARKRNAEGSHTLEQWQNLQILYNNKCAICKQIKPLTKDHIIPLSEGGTDYIENIQPLCRNCNSKKWKHIYENKELLDKDGGNDET
ncbi:hypothetical protein ES703_54493 [subsurface metagenome]